MRSTAQLSFIFMTYKLLPLKMAIYRPPPLHSIGPTYNGQSAMTQQAQLIEDFCYQKLTSYQWFTQRPRKSHNQVE